MKNNRLFYNLAGLARMLLPLPSPDKLLESFHSRDDKDYIKQRVDYYCPLDSEVKLGEGAMRLDSVRFTHKKTTYCFDTYEWARYFPQDLKAHFEFGDVNYICSKPSITKSRPTKAYADSIQTDLAPSFANSTLLNLDKIRHFTFIDDPYTFDEKRNKLFYRGGIYQEHRVKFFEKHFQNPLCDIGHTGKKTLHKMWQKDKTSIKNHLPYKFLLSLEGNDVASNLKWVMSSHSLAVMTKPKFETWFMEGTLLPNIHYVEIQDDYNDLQDKLEYFISHPNEAKAIIHNANEYTKQFFDKKREAIISLLVLEKYLYYTGQIKNYRI